MYKHPTATMTFDQVFSQITSEEDQYRATLIRAAASDGSITTLKSFDLGFAHYDVYEDALGHRAVVARSKDRRTFFTMIIPTNLSYNTLKLLADDYWEKRGTDPSFTDSYASKMDFASQLGSEFPA